MEHFKYPDSSPTPVMTSHWGCHGSGAMAILLINFIDEISDCYT
jgi:hypothetical protein